MFDATRRCCTRQGGQQRRVTDEISDCTQNKGIQCNFDSFFFQIMDELAAETMMEKKKFNLVDKIFSYKSKPALFVG